MRLAALLVAAMMAIPAMAQAPALATDEVIALPDTGGRIDHLAIDVKRKHLFVAELGNGTVDVIDLAARKVIHRIKDLKEPQGIAYEPRSDLVAVASGGDGTLRLYGAADFKPRGVIKLGDDADNVRVDGRNGHLVVGYGDGALAVIDPVKAVKLSEVKLPGHPESFRLSGGKVFVNIPDARQIAVADLDGGRIAATWKQEALHSNFPLMLDDAGHVAVVFRSPARLVLFDAATGKPGAAADTCGDSDDLFFDAARKRFYVSCGAGSVDVFAAGDLKVLGRVQTQSGARTSLFVPELDRLFVAERAGLLGHQAAIRVLKPL
ncbi:MAG TPA: WD40 repeat domain-containing protein [Rhizomicrobium sp.]|nr:WD40 repeat domain-containing protein [Rhizomicrobium sp.]